ncbi:MAG: MaoC/PaaZ C-terminal domain-containing protein [Myxococcota bacterium]
MSEANPDKLYYENYAPGFELEAGTYLVTEEEILEFGRRFDAQPMHNDKAAAEAGPFGGLIAPGCLTFAIRTALANKLPGRPALIAGLGVERMDLPKPVRPGDRLSLKLQVTERRRSSSRPERGIITMEQHVLNQASEAVLSMTSRMMVEVRNPENAID